MAALVNVDAIRSIAASLALHAAIAFGLSAGVRKLAYDDASEHHTRSKVAWSGETFEVDEVARMTQAPEPARENPQPAQARPIAPVADAPREEPSERRSAASVVKPASVAAAQSAPGSAAGQATVSGTFGAAGLPPGVRSLPGAFARAIVPATRADTTWQTLPLGPAGSIWVVIEVDDAGKIVGAEPDPERHRSEPVPLHLKRLVERTVLLLGAGTFALSKSAGAGTEKLSIEVELSQRAPSDDSEPNHVTHQGQEPPTLSRPGRAYFTLGSGRHFEARVTIVKG